MKFGYFDDNAKEYVITTPDTPLPWINYLGSQDFFSLISNTCGGYSFYKDAKLLRITRYRYNNIPVDSNGKYYYIHDGEEIWNPGSMPSKTPLDSYECHHGIGYSRFLSSKNGLKANLLAFVPVNSTCEINKLTLTNTTDIDFVREVGKHITVNYMMAKDSVKRRLNGEARDGLSFTEFTYQLLQGYDFLHLYETKGCKLQMGGSDQWGNITTGAELIRRTNGGEVFALTCPLITKADGGKFGKTESGNIWLDPRYTSPYKFYQFWLNVSDSDAERYIKIFTSIEKEEIEALIAEHQAAPHLRLLQKRLAKEVTVMVHSEEDYNAAVDASNILFGNATSDALRKLDEDTLLAVFEGVPQFEISRDALAEGVKAVDLFVDNAAVFASKGEMRKLVQGGGVSLNKEKLTAFDQVITTADLLDEKYLLVQRGKKNYFLLIAK